MPAKYRASLPLIRFPTRYCLLLPHEAVLIAAFVLMRQNRIGMIADRRDHLDLQVNLLTERRATQVIRMLNRLSTHLGVEQPKIRIAKSLNGASPSNIWWKRYIAG
jgi:uncharacterized membrane protein